MSMRTIKRKVKRQRMIVSALFDELTAQNPEGIFESKGYAKLLREDEKLSRILEALNPTPPSGVPSARMRNDPE